MPSSQRPFESAIEPPSRDFRHRPSLHYALKPIRALNLRITVLGLLAATLTVRAAEPTFWSWAKTPPMGWNSWDCYGAGVWESNVIANADYMADKLKPHGWDIVTIDIQWYEPLAHTDAYRRGAVLVREVAPDSVLAKGGLQKGDVILSLNEAAVNDVKQLVARARTLSVGQSLTVGISRG